MEIIICPERLTLDFLKWVWNFPVRSLILSKLEIHQKSKQISILKNPILVLDFLEQIEAIA